MAIALPSFLQESSLELIFFGGKGGVGKTTCACATALRLAADNVAQAFLLISTDPAHSVLDTLADIAIPSNLDVRELDPARALHDFKSRYENLLMEIADRGTFFDAEDLQGLMDLSIPGMDEVAAYLEIADFVKTKRYHCIIMDTAPTGHTLRLLEMPELVHRWLVALDSLLAKHRYIRRHYAGNLAQDYLDEFLLDMENTVQTMQNALRDRDRCRFVMVMVAESMSVEESADLAMNLRHRHIGMSEVVVNQLLPANDCLYCQAGRKRQLQALDVAKKRITNSTFWGLPLLPQDPSGQELVSFWSHVFRLDTIDPLPSVTPLIIHVETPQELPSARFRLMIFAGKGGVGKTTMACATALRMREEHPRLRILLFSTDPAHSLSDALGIPVGSQPTDVLPGLAAQEIEAEVAFNEVRKEYRNELEKFLADALPNLDITFDREVLEHLLDMAPPGLDEIMALTAVMEHLEKGVYDLVVMDAAPSGHLIRLLDLPDLIGAWLKLFFSLLLKYRKVMRLPRLSDRLVRLSRELKALRALLVDSNLTALWAITIPTRLALDKSMEMIDNLTRIGLNPSYVFINQITPKGECTLCSAINLREMTQISRAHEIFPDKSISLVYLQSDPGGLKSLGQLGKSLYR
ncbi:MAG: ArsA family ATPase [Methylococcus sp.]